jgi:hypothetical protein
MRASRPPSIVSKGSKRPTHPRRIIPGDRRRAAAFLRRHRNPGDWRVLFARLPKPRSIPDQLKRTVPMKTLVAISTGLVIINGSTAFAQHPCPACRKIAARWRIGTSKACMIHPIED